MKCTVHWRRLTEIIDGEKTLSQRCYYNTLEPGTSCLQGRQLRPQHAGTSRCCAACWIPLPGDCKATAWTELPTAAKEKACTPCCAKQSACNCNNIGKQAGMRAAAALLPADQLSVCRHEAQPKLSGLQAARTLSGHLPSLALQLQRLRSVLWRSGCERLAQCLMQRLDGLGRPILPGSAKVPRLPEDHRSRPRQPAMKHSLAASSSAPQCLCQTQH